jgi:uncharacterized protein YegL
LKSHDEQIKILESDHEIAVKVLDMTQCAGSPAMIQKASREHGVAMMECGSGARRTYHFKDAMSVTSQFRSRVALVAAQRAAKMALGKKLGQHAYRSGKGHAAQNPGKEDAPTAEDEEAMEENELLSTPPPPVLDPTDMGKCSVSGSASCPLIRDSLSQLVGEIQWALDVAKKERVTTESHCTEKLMYYKKENEHWQLELKNAITKLSDRTAAMNRAEEGMREKVQEANDVTTALTEKRQQCAEKIKEGAETLCGIRTIRAELMQMGGEDPKAQDCVVSDWEMSPCSAECGGGERTMTRVVVVPASGGAECPPLSVNEACNMQPCPIDCVQEEWSNWGACSKDCGGGVMVRSRHAITEEENFGLGCGASEDPRQCNTESCNRPCELDDWSDWTLCSKECDFGKRYRFRAVETEAGPEGTCPEPRSPERMQEAPCNSLQCPPDLVCMDEMDLVVLMDGSGSVEWTEGGWEAQKTFVDTLLKRVQFGEKKAKVGVMLFSYDIDTVTDMTFDKDAAMAAVAGVAWPGWNTNTAGALSRADLALQNGGRSHVSKEKTIVFLITDGNPNDMEKANAAAETIKEKARLVVVPVGHYVDVEAVDRWASFPTEQNVLPIPEFEEAVSYLDSVLADICQHMGFIEALTGNGQDYIGGQSITREGIPCQNWNVQYPHEHRFIPAKYADQHIGDHNFCRNPDGDSTIWCYTTDQEVPWAYCDPRDTSEIHPQDAMEYYETNS